MHLLAHIRIISYFYVIRVTYSFVLCIICIVCMYYVLKQYEISIQLYFFNLKILKPALNMQALRLQHSLHRILQTPPSTSSNIRSPLSE